MHLSNINLNSKAGFVLLTLICLAILVIGLKRVLVNNGFRNPRQILGWTSGLILAWIIIISVASLSGFLGDFSFFPPRMGLVLFLPLLIILPLTFSKKFEPLLLGIPPGWLVYIQFFRVPVEILLWMLYIQDLIPVQMTFEGRNFDILVGITAPLAGFFFFNPRKLRRFGGIVWNLAGLLLLGNILTLAILSMPTPIRYFMNEPANTIVAEFPFVWLPGILVPIAYTMHLFSLRQIYLTNKRKA